MHQNMQSIRGRRALEEVVAVATKWTGGSCQAGELQPASWLASPPVGHCDHQSVLLSFKVRRFGISSQSRDQGLLTPIFGAISS